MSILSHVEPIPQDPIFGMQAAIKRDKNKNKVDLTVGIYYDEHLENKTMRAVVDAERELLKIEKNKVYLPIGGDQEFVRASRELVFGLKFAHSEKKRFAGVQSLGGTHALRIGGNLFSAELTKSIYFSSPTWANHQAIFKASHMEINLYPYYDQERHTMEFDHMLDTIRKAPKQSVILLHACCHNPTGCDLTQEQWKELSELMLKGQLIPFFDLAYQGFDQGVEEDVWSIRYFAEKGHELFVAHSFSKSFGLYGERVGAFHALLKGEKAAKCVASVLKGDVRASISNPPRHGARLVAMVMGDQKLKKVWEEELSSMRIRVKSQRSELIQALVSRCGDDRFDFLKERRGLFVMPGLKGEKVDRLISEYSIYLTKSGRINLTGLNQENIPYVADAIFKMIG